MIIRIIALLICTSAVNVNADLSMTALSQLGEESVVGSVTEVSGVHGEDGERRTLVSYRSDGLTVYGLWIVPEGYLDQATQRTLVFAHGYHPNPPSYGRLEDGSNSRPGNYYRGLVDAYVSAGFAVFVPDYRGHNDSEGSEFTERALAAHWYTRDVINGVKAIKNDLVADSEQLYLSGHSMGGPIAIRTLIAMPNTFRRASLWSMASDAGPSYWMEQWLSARSEDTNRTSKPRLQQMRDELDELDLTVTDVMFQPLLERITTPIQLQHAIGDASTDVVNSDSTAAHLYLNEQCYRLYRYPSNDHLLEGQEFSDAIERDIEWFLAPPSC